MFDAMDGGVRAGARSASGKGSRTNTTFVRPPPQVPSLFATFGQCQKWPARPGGERKKTGMSCDIARGRTLTRPFESRCARVRFAPPLPKGEGKATAGMSLQPDANAPIRPSGTFPRKRGKEY